MKKSYEVITPLRDGSGDPMPAGTIVELDEKEGDALVAIQALAHSSKKPEKVSIGQRTKPVAVDPAKPAEAKPLAEQNLDELKATAKAEKVKGWGLIRDEAKLRQAIEAHRASKA